MQKFINPALSDYSYDAATDTVYSNKSGASRPLKWSKTSRYGERYVTLSYGAVSRKIGHGDIRSFLEPIEQQKIQKICPAVTTSLSNIKPDFEYIMFSTRNQVSQYFFAGTTIQEALDKFAKRGAVINPEDIRILNPKSNVVTSLKIGAVVTYSL